MLTERPLMLTERSLMLTEWPLNTSENGEYTAECPSKIVLYS